MRVFYFIICLKSMLRVCCYADINQSYEPTDFYVPKQNFWLHACPLPQSDFFRILTAYNGESQRYVCRLNMQLLFFSWTLGRRGVFSVTFWFFRVSLLCVFGSCHHNFCVKQLVELQYQTHRPSLSLTVKTDRCNLINRLPFEDIY